MSAANLDITANLTDLDVVTVRDAGFISMTIPTTPEITISNTVNYDPRDSVSNTNFFTTTYNPEEVVLNVDRVVLKGQDLQTTLQGLQSSIDRLASAFEDLALKVEYMPGGAGFERARASFQENCSRLVSQDSSECTDHHQVPEDDADILPLDAEFEEQY